MKFGTSIMGVGLRFLPEVARGFEENGFESIWLPEHLVLPATMPATYPYSDSGKPTVTPQSPTYDPWVLHALIAGGTERIRLATNVYVAPLRHPIQTARSVVTLDRISNGRVTLGVGIGWLREEFDAVGIDFRTRARRTDSAIKAIRRLWTEDEIEMHDEFLNFGPVTFYPKPRQRPSIPIEIGGASPPALRRAGRLGDGWVEFGSRSVTEFADRLQVVQAARSEADRSGPFEVSVCGELSTERGAYAALRDAGATRIVVDPMTDLAPRPSPSDMVDWAKRFADEVITQF